MTRSYLRRTLGKYFYTAKRYLEWLQQRSHFATETSDQQLSYPVIQHHSLLLRPLPKVDMWLQHNKIQNLALAIQALNGLLIHPGQWFSFWYLVGNPTQKRGFKLGMTLQDGKVKPGYGGGLCQLSNLIYWMALHSPLTIQERWRHSYDVFPDTQRTLPFGSGATVAYNYIDLQLSNPTQQPFQLVLWLSETELWGEFRSAYPWPYQYEVVEKASIFRGPIHGRYTRHNQLYRRVYDRATANLIQEELVAVNDALLMYEPFLAADKTAGP